MAIREMAFSTPFPQSMHLRLPNFRMYMELNCLSVAATDAMAPLSSYPLYTDLIFPSVMARNVISPWLL